MAAHHIIPTHCTGWNAITHIEHIMPEQFLLNMAATKLILAGK